MRDRLTWGACMLFLLAALYTVHLRREVYAVGQSIGGLEQAVLELERANDNLELEVDRLRSPGRLLDRAEESGVVLASPKGGTR